MARTLNRIKLVSGLITLGLLGVTPMLTPAHAAESTIGGTAFRDDNRNGSYDAGEVPLSGQRVYLLNSAGNVVAAATTDTAGTYAFPSVGSGSYQVQYAPGSWWDIRYDYAPTTTGSLSPMHPVTVPTTARYDFGWRPIRRSSDVTQPITTYVGSSGLRVESFDDVVPARDIYDAVMRGTVGGEASSITVRFDFGASSSTSTTASTSSDGRYVSFAAAAYVSYESWLDGSDNTLSHEYGHAWSLYHAYISQQDASLSAYLRARGLDADPRVDSSYGWDRRELIAEDYRQLLGSPTARTAPQTNRDIPPAADVPGLEQFLRSTWTASTSSPTPTATPSPGAGTTLAVTGLAVSPQPVRRSGAVSFSLSAPATIDVEIRDANNAMVRQLLATNATGDVSVNWNRLDDRGRKVRAGTYLAVVTASANNATVVESVQFAVA